MTAYTGAGARSTPADVLLTMRKAAARLAELGYTLRTGGAEGADRAFFQGAYSQLGEIELYLPWPDFWAAPLGSARIYECPSREAYAIAERYHPNWRNLRHSVRSLHARNVHQVLGPDLDEPARFILCWTPDGSGSGGTGQAIRITGACRIPVFDLGRPDTQERLRGFLATRATTQEAEQASVIPDHIPGVQSEASAAGPHNER